MKLEEKAKELAQLLKETEEYKNLTSAQTRLKLDPIAEDLVKQMQEKQQQIYLLQMEGKEPTVELFQELRLLEAKIRSNLTLNNLIKAQEAFGRKMNEINETIGKELFS